MIIERISRKALVRSVGTSAVAFAAVALYACHSTEGARDAGSLSDANPDALPAHCCPIDYYLCNGGRTGGTRSASGTCPGSADVSYDPRVITTDQNGCPMIDRQRSTARACNPEPPAPQLDASTDAADDSRAGG